MTIKEEIVNLKTEFDKVQKELLQHMSAQETLENRLANFAEFKELAEKYKAQAEKLSALLEELSKQTPTD